MIKKFSIPGYYRHFYTLDPFLRYYYDHRDKFYPDREIHSVYDAHDEILWNGGRESLKDQKQISMYEIMDAMNKYPVELWHVCSNCLITKEIANDYRTNQFMRTFLRPNDKVIITHPILIEHFMKNYPNTELVFSTTLNLTDINDINDISQNHIYCLTYNFNNNNEFLNKLKYKKNVEILCAEPCVPNCPFRSKH